MVLSAAKLREKDKKELENLVISLKKDFFDLKVRKNSAEFNEGHRFSILKRQIARILTILNEKNFKS